MICFGTPVISLTPNVATCCGDNGPQKRSLESYNHDTHNGLEVVRRMKTGLCYQYFYYCITITINLRIYRAPLLNKGDYAPLAVQLLKFQISRSWKTVSLLTLQQYLLLSCFYNVEWKGIPKWQCSNLKNHHQKTSVYTSWFAVKKVTGEIEHVKVKQQK